MLIFYLPKLASSFEADILYQSSENLFRYRLCSSSDEIRKPHFLAGTLQKYENSFFEEILLTYRNYLQNDLLLSRMLAKILIEFAFLYSRCSGHTRTKYVSPYRNQINFEDREMIKKFPEFPNHPSEVFFHHHGLRHLSSSVLDFLLERDFIDCGAYNGDSFAVLSNYTHKRIFSYELMPDFAERARKYAEKIPRVYVINKGLSEFPGNASVTSKSINAGGSSMRDIGDSKVEITTIDQEVSKFNISVGLIKADIEGYELPVLKGAINTIRTQKPVLSFAIYHNEQIVDVPKFINSLGFYDSFIFSEGVKPNFHFWICAYPKN